MNNGKNMNGLVKVERDLTKELSDLLDEFHATLFKILKLCRTYEPNNIDLEWCLNKLSLARDVDPLIIINKAADKLWYYRNHIIDENLDFFMNTDFDGFIKNDENKTFMYTLVHLVKRHINKMSGAELSFIWKLCKKLLECCIKYKQMDPM